MKTGHRLLLLKLCPALLLLFFGAAVAQDTPANPPENAAKPEEPAPAPAPAPPAVIAIPDIVATADTSRAFLKSAADALESEAKLGTGLSEIIGKIDEREDAKRSLLKSRPTLAALRDAEAEWTFIDKTLATFKARLTKRVADLEASLNEIERLDGLWRETLKSLGSATSAETPPEVLARVQIIITDLKTTRSRVISERRRLLSVQERVADQEKRSAEAMDAIEKARDTAVTEFFVRMNPPLWKVNVLQNVRSGLAADIPATYAAQASALTRYLTEYSGRLLAHGFLLVFLLVAVNAIARHIRGWVSIDPELEKPCFVFDFPYSTAVILAVACGFALYPLPPPIWRAALVAIALFPTIRLLKRPLPRPLWPLLNSLSIFFVANRLCTLTSGVPLVERLIFLVTMLSGIAFLVWLLRFRLTENHAEIASGGVTPLLRKCAFVILGFFSIAFIADVLGYLDLARLVGNGALTSIFFATFFRAFVRIADGLVVFGLRSLPLRLLGMIKRHRTLIAARIERLVRFVALVSWGLVTLEIFSLFKPAQSLFMTIVKASLPIQEFRVSLWDFFVFGGVVYLSVLISRFVRFILAEEVYPRAHLARGIPFAVSTVVHYALLLIGLFIALAMAGIDLTRITVLVGALGVGIGFGLQNIVNNFVSGLILLFERPVNVGDMVDVNAQFGELRRIGLRASVLRTPDGSEIIVPNGDLISNNVTNWTLTDQQRRLEIPVGVAYGTDPERVIEILLAVADNHKDILKNPAPQALFMAFGESSLDFILRAWTNEYQRWPIVRSELATAIWRALKDAEIPIPFPQRDLHLITVPPKAPDLSGPVD
jgi:potassium efflux system protein